MSDVPKSQDGSPKVGADADQPVRIFEKPNSQERLFSALAYPFWYVTFPVFLLSREKTSAYARYHVYQGLFLGLTLWIGGIALWNVSAFLGRFILLGLLLYPMLRLAEWIALGVTVYSALSAWLGSKVRLPFITKFTEPFLQAQDA
jgi:uncharacterized membrane protein